MWGRIEQEKGIEQEGMQLQSMRATYSVFFEPAQSSPRLMFAAVRDGHVAGQGRYQLPALRLASSELGRIHRGTCHLATSGSGNDPLLGGRLATTCRRARLSQTALRTAIATRGLGTFGHGNLNDRAGGGRGPTSCELGAWVGRGTTLCLGGLATTFGHERLRDGAGGGVASRGPTSCESSAWRGRSTTICLGGLATTFGRANLSCLQVGLGTIRRSAEVVCGDSPPRSDDSPPRSALREALGLGDLNDSNIARARPTPKKQNATEQNHVMDNNSR